MARHDRAAGPRPALPVVRSGDDRLASCASTTCPARSPPPRPGGRGCPTAARRCSSSSAASTPTRTPSPGPWPTTPQTFVAGDWKLGNLGSRPDGRTIVLDWAYPGEAPPCWELAWYLALNCDRLPRSKEDTIAAYRRGLEEHGVDTAGWWDRQLGLCMVGMMATMAWEKALGDDDELRWWERAALDGSQLLVSVMVADPARGAYAGAGPAWAADASLVYEPLARHLVARSPDLARRPARARRRRRHGRRWVGPRRPRGAVVESDIEPTMLDHARADRPAAVAADVAALPFRSGVFDAVVAAFVLNHVADPAAALAELARVTRPGGFVLASTFAASRSPAKEAFDDAPAGTVGAHRRGTTSSAPAKPRSARSLTSVPQPGQPGSPTWPSSRRPSMSASTTPSRSSATGWACRSTPPGSPDSTTAARRPDGRRRDRRRSRPSASRFVRS